MGYSLLVLIGWLAAIVCGIILILRGRDNHNRLLTIAGSLLIAVVTVYGFICLVL